MQSPSPHDRKRAINDVTRLVAQVEKERFLNGKNKVAPDASVIRQATIDWERGVFANCGGDGREYMQRVATKRRALEACLVTELNQRAPDAAKEAKRLFVECRAILRVVSLVCPVATDAPLKDEFINLFKSTMSMTTDADKLAFTSSMSALHAKLRPRAAEATKILGVDVASLVEIEDAPFGILNQMVKINGTAPFAKRARRISVAIGGKQSLCKQ